MIIDGKFNIKDYLKSQFIGKKITVYTDNNCDFYLTPKANQYDDVYVEDVIFSNGTNNCHNNKYEIYFDFFGVRKCVSIPFE